MPRLALNQQEAAEALGVSVDTFVRHIRASLPSVPCGGHRLWRVSTLDRWLADRERGVKTTT